MESQSVRTLVSKKRAHDGELSSGDESNEDLSSDQPRRDTMSQKGNRKPHTFKACSECRQQKLRCEFAGDTGGTDASCIRCQKHNLQCKIVVNFKRVKKRGKYEELLKEVEELRAKLANKELQDENSSVQNHQQLVDGGILPSSRSSITNPQSLDDVSLSGERIAQLYNEFLTFYNPLLPIIDPELAVDHYYNVCPLLGWTIVVIASRRSRHEPTLLAQLTAPYTKLLWATIGNMPLAYHLVKALCLLCTWPLPTSGSNMDFNFLLGGIMMQIALQNGLHRPAFARDFGRNITSISNAEVRDRTLTWCACNIVLQRATYSQPSRTLYDWTLGGNLTNGISLGLPGDLLVQLKIEKFCDKVSKTLFENSQEPLGILPEMEQAATMSVLRMEYREIEASLADDLTAWNKFHFLAAGIRLHAFAFFIPRTSAAYSTELLHLYNAATIYIETLLEYEANTSTCLRYCPLTLQQVLTSACTILIKLLNSSFAIHLDLPQGKMLFNSSVLAFRNMSIRDHDLPARTAEILLRVWRAAGERSSNPVELTIRSRMSASHVFDCIWIWKEGLGESAQQHARPATSQAIGTSSQFGAAGDSLPLYEGFNGLSALQDFDLFNTWDWVLDENAIAWPDGPPFPPLP